VFIGGPAEEDPQSEGHGGYHSEETVITSDSEDELFFLEGELAATSLSLQINYSS